VKIQVPIVTELTDEQVKEHAAASGLPHGGGPLRAKDVVDDARAPALASVQGLHVLVACGATVTLK
jgi:hypothetical protein